MPRTRTRARRVAVRPSVVRAPVVRSSGGTPYSTALAVATRDWTGKPGVLAVKAAAGRIWLIVSSMATAQQYPDRFWDWPVVKTISPVADPAVTGPAPEAPAEDPVEEAPSWDIPWIPLLAVAGALGFIYSRRSKGFGGSKKNPDDLAEGRAVDQAFEVLVAADLLADEAGTTAVYRSNLPVKRALATIGKAQVGIDFYDGLISFKEAYNQWSEGNLAELDAAFQRHLSHTGFLGYITGRPEGQVHPFKPRKGSD